jgi:hypothetical protein
MQATPGPEWQPKLKELVDLLLEREDAVTRRDPGASRFYDGLIRTLLQQLRAENAPLSLVGELLAGARAKRDLEKERQKVQELETKLREKEYFDEYRFERRAEEEKQRAKAAREAEEEKQRAEAARKAEEETRLAAAARQAGEEGQWAETRTIDANLLAERFAPGETATLTIVVRLPSNPARGKWQGTATIDRTRGPARVLLEAQGFTVLSEPPPPFPVPEDRDTAPLAFELRIEEASERWLHVILMQGGRPAGELTISDFSAVGHGPVQQAASSAFRSVAEADLMLVVRAADGRIEACSPRERASLDHVTMVGFKYPAIPFRERLANHLRSLYDDRSDPEQTARELQIVGVELADCLPADLVKLLRHPDIRSVMLRHEDDFDFPLELCYLDDATDPFFVGDRIATCRWYLGVTSLPDIIAKRSGKWRS